MLLDRAEPALMTGVAAALEMLKASVEPDFNVVRVAEDGSEVAFLDYPDFFETPFPALKESWRVAALSLCQLSAMLDNVLTPS